MITINGQKMAKSLNNGVLITELFEGNHPLLEQAYSPMTLKFFVLQAHYRGTLDFSNEALKAAEKGFQRLMNAVELLDKLKPGTTSDFSVANLKAEIYSALNEDFNTPIALAGLFEAASWINKINDSKASLTAEDLTDFTTFIKTMVFDVFGLVNENATQGQDVLAPVVQILIDMRNEAKANKDYARSDAIRKQLADAGVELKDGKEGTTFNIVK